MVEILKSPADDRDYLFAELPNGLKCLVISDPDTDISAGAMCVASGSLRDPRDIPGLSHFLEHMLFLGTEKYPNENTYNTFIKENSGSSNAYTGHEETNYYFSIAKDKLEQALDIFAEFFVAPLFTESCVEREMRAVDSENTKNLKSDEWRVHQLICSLASPTHPYNHFATGNLTTLQLPDIRDKLIRHYQGNYSAHLMAMVLLGREDTATLMSWCRDRFARVPISPETRPFPQLSLPFDSTRLGTITKVVSVMDRKELKILWQLPQVREHYESKPHNYISHLIGHEGTNSILSMLKADGLAQELSAGIGSHSYKDYSFFAVSIQMTDKGMEQYERVLEIVCHYVTMLRNKGVQEWIFQELKNLAKAEFQFKSKSSPMNYTLLLASSLHKYPPQHLLTALNLIETYRPELISQLLELLVPSNMQVYLISKEFEVECDESEPWYGTRYLTTAISTELMTKLLHPNITHATLVLDLPPRNRFIPDTFTILPPVETMYPAIVFDSDMLRVYHKQDTNFRKDSVLAYVNLFCSDSGYFHTAIGHLCGEFWKKLFTDRTRELSYLADQAGLKLNVSNQTFGLGISAQGFSQHFGDYLEEVFTQIAQFEVTENDRQFFEDYLDDTKRALENYLLIQPYEQTLTTFSELVCANVHFTLEELRKTLPQVSLDDLIYFSKKWLRNIYCEWLLVGNVSAEQAKEIAAKCLAAVTGHRQTRVLNRDDLPPELHMSLSTHSPQPESFLVYEVPLTDKSNQNSCVLAYWQLGMETLEARAEMLIIESLLKEPCFSILRTKKQLGYIVFSVFRNKRRILGHFIIVQSHVAAPAVLADHISDFLGEMRPAVAELSDEAFATHRDSVYTNITKRDISLEEEFGHFAIEMIGLQYQFDKREKLGEALQRCTKASVQATFERLFFTQCKRLDIEYVSANLSEAQAAALSSRPMWTFKSVSAFKRALPIYPGQLDSHN